MVNLPSLRIPSLGNLGGQLGEQVSTEENRIAQAAKQQVEDERGEESLFWKVLEMIGRPQHAVAGVLTDLIDGQDFSPLDRIGKALAGSEKYRMKDFIDVISPGAWSQMKLPDFLGGKDVDITKEVIGFLGDVFTDPIMATRTFTLMKRLHPITGEHIDALSYWDKLSKGKIFGEAAENARKVVDSRGLTQQVATTFLHRKNNMLQLKNMWLDAMKSTDEFMAKYIPRNKMFEFAETAAPYLGTEFALPTIAAQFAARQRSLMSFVTPFAKSLGIKPDQFALIPKFADDLAGALVKGVDKLYEGFAMTKAGSGFLNGVHAAFRSGSGNKVLDYWATITASVARRAGQSSEDHIGELKRIMGHKTDDEMSQIMKYAEQPNKDWGLRPREFGEKTEDIPEEFKDSVTQVWDYFDSLYARETENPLLRYQGITRQPWTHEKAHRVMSQELKKERPELAKKLTSVATMKGMAKKATEKLGKSNKLTSGKMRELEESYVEALVEADLHKGAQFLGRSIPSRPMGYVPHEMTPEAEGIFLELFRNPAIRYGNKNMQMADYVMQEMSHRVPGFRELTASALNEGLDKGIIEWDMFNSFTNQVFSKLKGKPRGKFDWWLGQMDPEQLKFWIEDPIQLYALRAQKSINAVRKADFLRGAIRSVGRRLQLNDAPTPLFGETTAILSKEGMEAYYGKAWRTKIGEDAAVAYDEFLKAKRLDPKNELSGIFLDVNLDDIAIAHGKRVPIFGVPTADMEDIARTFKIHSDPKEWNTFLRNWDQVTNWFKATSLAIFPAYHARNVMSGFWQAHLGGTLDPTEYQKAFSFLSKGGNWQSGFPGGVKNAHAKIFGKPSLAKAGESVDDLAMDLGNGVIYSYDKQLEDMHKFGVFTGIYATEMKQASTGALTSKAPGKVKGAALQLTQYGTPIKAGFAVGNYFDNVHRIAHYRGMVKQGKTPFEAAMSVKKYFFDYDELTQFERTWLRRFALPFYTWTRKNLPLQLEAIMTQPGKYGNLGRAVEWFQSDEAKNMDRSLMPKWMQEQFGVPTRFNKKTQELEVMMLRSWVPAMDLMAVIHENPVHAAVRTVATLAHPIPKGIMEQHLNQSFYTGKPIEDFGGEPYPGGFLGMPMSKRAVHAFKTLRLPAEVERLRRQDIEGAEWSLSERVAAASGLVPKKKKIKDPQERLEKDIAKVKGTIRRKYNAAKKYNDPILIKYYKDMLEDVSRSKK